MFKFSRRTKIIIVFVALVVAGYGLIQLTRGGGGVPSDFTSARLEGAIIAQNIVNISNQSTADLERVNELDEKREYAEALDLATDLVARTQEIRDQAVELSIQVSEMTKALSGITDFAARQAALESISSRLAVINQLINYSADLSRLLDLLRNRFAGSGGVTNVQVRALVDQINTDVNAINNFNSQAGQAMDRFDNIVGM